MKNHTKLSILLFVLIFFASCQEREENNHPSSINFEGRKTDLSDQSNLISGSSYLSVYSEIYSNTENRTHTLTVTVSLRNVNSNENIYITKADYFDTHGKLINQYLTSPIYIKPLETVEIIIDKSNTGGGTGGNFIFDWAIDSSSSRPLFEAVMISTSGQQGISFTTQAVQL